MTADHKKLGVAFWATLVATVLALYVACFGAACAMCESRFLSQRTAWMIFRPLTWLVVHAPAPADGIIESFAVACGDKRRVEPVWIEHDPEHTSYGGMKCMRDSVSPIDYEFVLGSR